jgi:hypothetical protein
MLKFMRLCVGILALGLSAGTAPALAQSADSPPRVSIPLEVAMIYHKLINTAPNFDQLAQYSPRLTSVGTFGREAILAEEKSNLEDVYKKTRRDTLIIVRLPLAVQNYDSEAQTLSLKTLDGDTPFTFDVGATTYGVFIRNAAFVSPITTPYLGTANWGNIQILQNTNRLALVELTLKPLGADDANFKTFDDQTVKPILADLIDIKVFDPQYTDNLLLHKRDVKAFEQATKLERLVEDDLTSDQIPSFKNTTGLPKAVTP